MASKITMFELHSTGPIVGSGCDCECGCCGSSTGDAADDRPAGAGDEDDREITAGCAGRRWLGLIALGLLAVVAAVLVGRRGRDAVGSDAAIKTRD
ncbi:MAG: hypothetical protein ABEJ86_05975 [Halococcoides sp.]